MKGFLSATCSILTGALVFLALSIVAGYFTGLVARAFAFGWEMSR